MKKVKCRKINRKKLRFSAIVFAIVLVFVLSLISALRDMFADDTNTVVTIDIPKGAGFSEIADILEENKVIDHKLFFKIYEKFAGERVYQSGKHNFVIGMSYGNALEALTQINCDVVTVTIPEGFELRQIAKLLEQNGICSAENFKNAALGDFPDYPYLQAAKNRENPLEGYLFPDTYEFEKGENPTRVIEIILENFDKKVYSVYKESKTDKSLDNVIIMASVIEREAANDQERGKVSSVFYNRLKIGMKLQSCATVQYILKERKEILSLEDTRIDSPYNTYLYEGLPKGPIASPGINSVKAAINPEETEYYYFAASKDGAHNVFSKTWEEHLKTIKELGI